jgi:uracil phosphoribosyltransferase
MQHLTIVDHPFVIDSLAHLRDKNSGLKKFRFHSDQLCKLLFSEAIRGLEFNEVKIETPVSKTTGKKLRDEVIILPILRAGLSMLYGSLQLLPKSKVGFVGLARDEKTAIASEYYWKLPKITPHSVVIITDPMLATGGTILHVLRKIAKEPAKAIRIVCVVAAPEGIKAVHKEFPNVEIFTAALDDHLNDKKYIVPGLGDFGDRYFGTT